MNGNNFPQLEVILLRTNSRFRGTLNLKLLIQTKTHTAKKYGNHLDCSPKRQQCEVVMSNRIDIRGT